LTLAEKLLVLAVLRDVVKRAFGECFTAWSALGGGVDTPETAYNDVAEIEFA
jgi:hypothetical protein